MIVSVWQYAPPVWRAAWTHSKADNSTTARRQISCLSPAVDHFILSTAQPGEKNTLNLSYHRHHQSIVHNRIFYISLFCPWRGLHCFWWWEVNEIKTPFVRGGLISLKQGKPKPCSSVNHCRTVYRKTHPMSFMGIILLEPFWVFWGILWVFTSAHSKEYILSVNWYCCFATTPTPCKSIHISWSFSHFVSLDTHTLCNFISIVWDR